MPAPTPFSPPTAADVVEAARRLEGEVHRTPVMTCSTLDGKSGGTLFFKCEHLQKVGAFKFRGATHAVGRLPDAEAAAGVVTHSSGNHGAALALAARRRGIPAYIVMPETAPRVKKAAVAGYGAQIVFCAPTAEARHRTAREVRERTGATMIHPYDHPHIIAGQGTATLELLDDVPDLDLILAPIGGGGLAAGGCLALEARGGDGTALIGVEPAAADDTARSFRAGERVEPSDPETLADGLKAHVGELTFPILRDHLEDVVTVPEPAIVAAMRTLWERMKLVVEPSGAVVWAAVESGAVDVTGRRVGLLLSGGNVDLDHLPWMKRDGREGDIE